MTRRCTLRTARERAGLTQEALARKAGIRQGVISKLENGLVANPRFSTVLSLARALKIDPAGLQFTAPEDHGLAPDILSRI